MDHCIGCHTCAFTVAYAILWLEAGFPTGVENIGGGGLLKIWWGSLSQHMEGMGGAWNADKKYLWSSSFDSKVASSKPVGLQIY